MKITIFGLRILFFFISITGSSQITREKQAILQKPFPSQSSNGSINNDTIGGVHDEFGDLFFEKNGKMYWLPTFTQITGPTLTYYRLFELIIDSGYAREVTNEMLGGYYFTGGLNPPYYYEDIDNDGIKDILIIDHGKEEEYKRGTWGSYNIFFKGTNIGFIKTDIKGITDIYAYHHGHAVADYNNDGKLDIAISGNTGIDIFQNEGNLKFTKIKIGQTPGKISPYALKFIKYGVDKNLRLLAPPYRDFDNSCCRAQTYLLNLNNDIWNVEKFGKAGPFSPAVNGLLWGCSQILTFKKNNSNSTDILFKVEGQYDPNGGWYTKYYKNSNFDNDSIVPLKSQYFDTAKLDFIDPKIIDINFDGYLDIVHKEYGYGGPRSPLNQRIWFNDSQNNFSPSTIKFDSLLSKQMYLFVKSDTLKKYNLFMTLNEKYINNNTTKIIYNRFDSLVYPISNEFNVKLCEGETIKTQLIKVPISMSIVKQSQKGKITIADSTASYTASAIGSDTVTFKLKNDFFESVEYKIIYTIIPKPIIPIIFRDTSNRLVSNANTGNFWYKDGTLLTDTAQKIKPTVAGSYTVKTTQNGCISASSAPYYYLVTDIINLANGEYIKLAPNPFHENLYFDFRINGYSNLNIEIFELTTGNKVDQQKNVYPGSHIQFDRLNPGTYLIKVFSSNGKLNYQFKMVKL